ncbi:protease [Calothrix parasitica NIES-267]|uniref:Protease n=1 Tax=Calothrix parasitica NIES-267 TaxID=1973488 RepID=A0A1Z4M041_9CYAN|nr:protease [Calothrix parasitica NIES-267]
MGNFSRRLFALFLTFIFCWEFLPGVGLAQTVPKAPTSQSNQFSIQPYLDRVVENLTEFKLDNGMKFIVLRRPQAPVVSFLTYADVGGVDEPVGKTGVAHFLEHLAFKGTDRIGTNNYAKEKRLLDRLDEIAAQIQQAQTAGQKDKVAQLQARFEKVEKQASEIVKQNELGRIVEQAGGVGLNATTSSEATKYFYSFPSNKLELWMSLESERFLNPELRREFFKEKKVILEERRMRVDNSPIGQMIENFNDTAFEKHPYKRPVIGYDEDIRNLTTQDVQQFFETYYVPSNLTAAVVGDVNAAEVKRLAEVYFGRYEAKPKPEQKIAVEPKQTQEKEFTLNLPSQPWYLEGYHRPSLNHPDNAVYDIIGSLLSDGRTSRLYKSLVEEKQLALAAQGFSGFPGDKYPNLMLFYALTAPGRSVDEVATALREQIEALKTKPVSAKELQRVKTNARAGLLRSLDSNMGMAQQLLEYEVKTGSWKNLFEQLEKIEAVTAQDVVRVARETFVSENRTVGKLLPKKSGS